MNSEILKLIESGQLDKAREALAGASDADSLYLLGRLEWKAGNRAAAISAYNASAQAMPGGPGEIALEQARRVMEFYNHDLYNP